MRNRPLSFIAAAAGGFLLASALWFWVQPLPAGAQAGGAQIPEIGTGFPLVNQQAPVQPIQIEALDPLHFVVVTREPRLGRRLETTGAVSNILVTVVSHYTVRPNGLEVVEHVRMPPGWEEIILTPSGSGPNAR